MTTRTLNRLTAAKVATAPGPSMLADGGRFYLRASPDPLNRIPRRLSGLLPGLVLCNFARGA